MLQNIFNISCSLGSLGAALLASRVSRVYLLPVQGHQGPTLPPGKSHFTLGLSVAYVRPDNVAVVYHETSKQVDIDSGRDLVLIGCVSRTAGSLYLKLCREAYL